MRISGAEIEIPPPNHLQNFHTDEIVLPYIYKYRTYWHNDNLMQSKQNIKTTLTWKVTLES